MADVESTVQETQVPAVTNPNYKPQEGYLGNLTVAQQETLVKFRAELKEEGIFVEGRMDDASLLRCVDPMAEILFCAVIDLPLSLFDRFLRARKWNLQAAKEMLVKVEEWRKKEDIDNIVK